MARVQSAQAQALVPARSLEHFLCVPLEPHSRQRITSKELQHKQSDGCFLRPHPPAAALLPVCTQSQQSERARGCRGIGQRHSVCKPPEGQNRRPPPTPTMHLWKEKDPQMFPCCCRALRACVLEWRRYLSGMKIPMRSISAWKLSLLLHRVHLKKKMPALWA